MTLRIYALIALTGCLAGACSTDTNTSDNKVGSAHMTGADQDEHGCKGSAGYQWSSVQNECVRVFETGIPLAPERAGEGTTAYLLFAGPDQDAQAEVFLPGQQTGLLMPRTPGTDAGTWALDTLTLSQWKGMYTLTGTSDQVLYQGHIETKTDTDGADVKPGPAVERLLQGSWQNLTDTGDTFTVNGATLRIAHTNQQPLSLAFVYVANCGGNVCAIPKSRYGCFTTAGEFDIDCQSIVAISNTELTITQGNAGKTVRYRRK